MLALGVDLNQMLGLEPVQVYARGRRANAGDHSKLGAGSRMIIHEGIEHARSSRLADCCSEPGDSNILVIINIHTLIIDEVWLSGKRYSREEVAGGIPAGEVGSGERR